MTYTVNNKSNTYDDKGNLVIVSALVGSRAHGLNEEDSDWDWRGVFVPPTTTLLKLGSNVKSTKWLEGKVDDTGYDIGYFLHRAVQCDPNILEIFASPHYDTLTPLGEQLIQLFPHVWSSQRVRDSHLGYSKNQQKKFLNPKSEQEEKRKWKFATAYIRSLYSAIDILQNKSFSIKLDDGSFKGKTRFARLKNIRNGCYSEGEIVDIWVDLQEKLQDAYNQNPDKECDQELINDFLLDVRRRYWEPYNYES